jgi:hypothetical protein
MSCYLDEKKKQMINMDIETFREQLENIVNTHEGNEHMKTNEFMNGGVNIQSIITAIIIVSALVKNGNISQVNANEITQRRIIENNLFDVEYNDKQTEIYGTLALPVQQQVDKFRCVYSQASTVFRPSYVKHGETSNTYFRVASAVVKILFCSTLFLGQFAEYFLRKKKAKKHSSVKALNKMVSKVKEVIQRPLSSIIPNPRPRATITRRTDVIPSPNADVIPSPSADIIPIPNRVVIPSPNSDDIPQPIRGESMKKFVIPNPRPRGTVKRRSPNSDDIPQPIRGESMKKIVIPNPRPRGTVKRRSPNSDDIPQSTRSESVKKFVIPNPRHRGTVKRRSPNSDDIPQSTRGESVKKFVIPNPRPHGVKRRTPPGQTVRRPSPVLRRQLTPEASPELSTSLNSLPEPRISSRNVRHIKYTPEKSVDSNRRATKPSGRTIKERIIDFISNTKKNMVKTSSKSKNSFSSL